MIYLPSEDTWYITRDVNAEEGDIRSQMKDVAFVPELGWEYSRLDLSNCETIR